jgi:hypothetical protein
VLSAARLPAGGVIIGNMKNELTTADAGLHTGVLDHASEFVARVATGTPGEYHRLLGQKETRQLLNGDNALNPGKLWAYAEFRVFRAEFRECFPGAAREACINAFCRLFLKNDISMSNLVALFEHGANSELDLLRPPGA